MNKVEQWKREKHGLDVWPDVVRYAEQRTPMKQIDDADLERMKWHGVFYRRRDNPESYMLRIRLTGCELNAEQAKEIAYIAYELGYGIVDITTRANIQLQGLPIEHVPKAIERLERCGLTARQTGHDNIRNVFCDPLSGLDPEELIDVRPLCRDISALFLGNRDYSDLPRKFNIAVSGRESQGLHYWSQDISYLATRTREGEVMFQVLIGGTQGQNPHLPWHLPVLVAPEQVMDVTRAILDLFRTQGSREKRDRARFRYLIERIGVAGVLEWLEQQLPYPLVPHLVEAIPPGSYEELVGWIPQKDPKRWAMGLCVPLGRISWQQMEGLARIAKKWGDGALRTTAEQGIMLTGIPTGFKGAAATDAAGLGLSPHADTLTMNTVACTGKQFCNIAVTETKGHMFQLISKLRQRALTLHGIRIHMSGCPSSCAQHHTADIGLKGVRVRRLLGTREGFDVYLGGGIAGQLHLGLLYRLGVDVDQLPQLIEEVVREYYLKHKAGQSFSAYWREILQEAQATKVDDAEYQVPTWICEGCGHRHAGEDPPIFCPSCAGLRRLFARLEGSEESPPARETPAAEQRSIQAPDGYALAASESELNDSQGLAVEVAGREYALFRAQGQVVAVDGACPHEGAPLAQGSIEAGVVTCPWHEWQFDVCKGCSLEPPGHPLRRYETKVEGGHVFIRIPDQGNGASAPSKPRASQPLLAQPVTAQLKVIRVIEETPNTKTFRLDNSSGIIPAHLPGQFAKVCWTIDQQACWRSFTISSSPTQTAYLDLTVKRNPGGLISSALHESLVEGALLTIKAPQGNFFFDCQHHTEPLVLVAAGSGVTPMMSILRSLADRNPVFPCMLLYGARTRADIIFADECQRQLGRMPSLRYRVWLTQPPASWEGEAGRLDFDCVSSCVTDLPHSRFFLCGPGSFMDVLREGLLKSGVAEDRIHTEQFHKSVVQVAQA